MPRLRRKSDIRAAARARAGSFRSVERFASDALYRTWRSVLVAALRDGAPVSAAAKAAGVSRSAAYKARARDADFAAAWDAAIPGPPPADAFDDPLEPKKIPIFKGGLQVGYRLKYDVTALLRCARSGVRSTTKSTGSPHFHAGVASGVSTAGDTRPATFSAGKGPAA
jgi:hypothetical protein